MRKVKVLILMVVFLLSMALPAMAQSDSSVNKGSFEGASFYGSEGTVNTSVDLFTNFEDKDSYILYYQTYDYEKEESYYGSVVVPATNAIFDVNKGTVKVNTTVNVYKVDFTCYEDGNCTGDETPVGTKSINLAWSFNQKSYSTSKYSDKNIQIDFDQYIKLSKGTFKNYNNVLVSGTVDGKTTDSFEYSGANVSVGSSFVINK